MAPGISASHLPAVRIALTIAGFDSSSGAGVTADLAVFGAHGIFGTSAVTALTAQSTVGVRAVLPIAPEFLAETLAEVAVDLPPSGIKIGMLADAALAGVVADFLDRLPARVPVVLDPVLRSSSGRPLLSDAGTEVLVQRLLPLATWVTPNRREWAVLTGCQDTGADDDLEARSAEARGRWPGIGFVVTGGDGERADDLFLPPGGPAEWMRADKIASRSTHGTGCAYSSALLSGLIHGQDGASAARSAKSYVAEAIRTAGPLGHGRGPLNLLWPLLRSVADGSGAGIT